MALSIKMTYIQLCLPGEYIDSWKSILEVILQLCLDLYGNMNKKYFSIKIKFK